MAATAAAKEIVWLRKLSQDLSSACDKATVLHIDNQSAIRLAKNPEFHQRTKHIEVKYHFIREKVASQEISLKFVPTENQKADIFTKAVPRERFYYLCNILGLQKHSEYSNSESIE